MLKGIKGGEGRERQSPALGAVIRFKTSLWPRPGLSLYLLQAFWDLPSLHCGELSWSPLGALSCLTFPIRVSPMAVTVLERGSILVSEHWAPSLLPSGDPHPLRMAPLPFWSWCSAPRGVFGGGVLGGGVGSGVGG